MFGSECANHKTIQLAMDAISFVLDRHVGTLISY